MNVKFHLDPTPEVIAEIIRTSRHTAARWLRSGNHVWYWRAEDAVHAEAARHLNVEISEKGIATLDDTS